MEKSRANLASAAKTGILKSDVLKFRTTLLNAGKTATGIVIPVEIIEQLGAGKKPPVKITINGFTYRSTVAVMAGKFMVSVSAENRKGAGIAGGDEIDVIIEHDTEKRMIEIPDDFQHALNNNQLAKENFDALSNSNKQRFTLPLKDAKTEETRKRRIESSISNLEKGKL